MKTIDEIVIGKDGACMIVGENAHALRWSPTFTEIDRQPMALKHHVYERAGTQWILRAAQTSFAGALRYWTGSRVLVTDLRPATLAS